MAMVVFTGGARSGKSSAAAKLASSRERDGATIQVAVFGRAGADHEFDDRIATHRLDRPDRWIVTEVDDPLAGLPTPCADGLLLVDCLGTAVGRLMEIAYERLAQSDITDAPSEALPSGFSHSVEASVDALVDLLCARGHDLIVVTNEVGDGVVPVFATGRLFQDLLGRANSRLVEAADASYLCVAGRLIALRDLPRQATWPQD